MKHLRALWPFLRPDAARFVGALLLTPLVAGVGLAQPIVLKNALDGHIVAGKPEGLQLVALAYLGLVVLGFLAEALYTVMLATGAESSIQRLRDALFSHTLSRSQRFFEKQPTGQLMTSAPRTVKFSFTRPGGTPSDSRSSAATKRTLRLPPRRWAQPSTPSFSKTCAVSSSSMSSRRFGERQMCAISATRRV